LLIGVFLITELRAIRKDRAEVQHQAAEDRKNQDLAFAGVLKAQNEQFTEPAQGFSSTYKKVDGVLNTTQNVAVLAKTNLENVTGGDSFGYVYPKVIEESDGFQMFLHNDGNQILSGVTVKISEVFSGKFGISGRVHMDGGSMNPIQYGTLPPHFGGSLPNYWITPKLRSDGLADYHILINAQNGGVVEELYFRPSQDRRSFAYKFEVVQKITGKRMEGDFLAGKAWFRYVKKQDWTEPTIWAEAIKQP